MMKTNSRRRSTIEYMVYSVVILIMAGCAARKPLAESPETGLTLKYMMPGDPGVQYHSKTTIKQSMEIQGQSITADIEQVMKFLLKPAEQNGSTLTFGITLDTLCVDIMSPMARFSADVSEVLGKSFDMKISTLGEELDVSGAEPIQYSVPQAGSRSIAINFQEFFPDLPENMVRVGDTWTEIDTISESSEAEEVIMVLESNHVFESVENINGFDCAKIVSQMKGPRTGKQNAQGITLNSDGDVEGTMTWYFAYKEGLYVKSETKSVISNMVSATGAQNLTFPLTMNINSVVEISK